MESWVAAAVMGAPGNFAGRDATSLSGQHELPGNGPKLSSRELEVLRLVAQSVGASRIAHALNISPHTVLNHIRNARRNLLASNRLDAVLTAQRLGLI